MKYVITESRLSNVIQKYLDSKLGDLEEVETLNEDGDIDTWFVNKSGAPYVIRFGPWDDIYAVSRNIYESVEKTFGLTTTEDIQNEFKKYFLEKWGVKVNAVYTYEAHK